MTSIRVFPTFNTFLTVKNVLQTHKFITFVTNIFCPSVLRSWSRHTSSMICLLREYAIPQCQISPSHSLGVPKDLANMLSHFKNQLLVQTQSQSLQEKSWGNSILFFLLSQQHTTSVTSVYQKTGKHWQTDHALLGFHLNQKLEELFFQPHHQKSS